MSACDHCDGTGSLSKQLEGLLDCAHCDAARTRVLLEGWCRTYIPRGASQSTAAWLIYQHGQLAGFNKGNPCQN